MNTAVTILTTAATLSLCMASNGKKVPAIEKIDPFIEVAEAMKHSVAPLACVAVNGTDSNLLARRGTAFFVSAAGEFMTAAHVLLDMKKDMQKNDPPCPVAALVLPRERYQPKALNEPVAWFSFKIADCVIKQDLDVAKCALTDDLSSQKVGLDFKIVAVKFDWTIPPDATQIAFTGFPMNARDPMTFRANVAAYRPVWRSAQLVDELLMDRGAWPGSSGSPVFLSDGRVIGILIASRTEEGTAMTTVRCASAVRALLAGPERK